MFRTTSVLLIDHHPLFRESLRAQLLAAGMAVPASCGDGGQAATLVSEHDPDVVVMEAGLPGVDGIQLARQIAERRTGSTRVLVLSDVGDGDVVYAAIAAGASGYLTKDTEGDEVCRAVRAVAAGEAVLGPGLGDGLFARIRTAERQTLRITEREHQVLVLAAEGRTVVEMGQELYLSAGTIKTHLAHVYGKLGVSDRGAAVAEAIRRELIA